MFRPFLVLSLNSLFVSVLEVIEFVLDCMEKSIEGIANILKKKLIVKIFGFVTLKVHLWGKREFEDIGDPSIDILWQGRERLQLRRKQICTSSRKENTGK